MHQSILVSNKMSKVHQNVMVHHHAIEMLSILINHDLIYDTKMKDVDQTKKNMITRSLILNLKCVSSRSNWMMSQCIQFNF